MLFISALFADLTLHFILTPLHLLYPASELAALVIA